MNMIGKLIRVFNRRKDEKLRKWVVEMSTVYDPKEQLLIYRYIKGDDTAMAELYEYRHWKKENKKS